jgi:hypothetical protein
MTRLSRQTDEVDEKSCALGLLAATHRGSTSGEHLLELEPALRPALTFTCSPRRRIRAFGRYAGKVWLHQLGGLLQLGRLVCAMRVVGGQRMMSVRSSGERGDEPGARSSDAAACRLSWRLAAHPAAARIRLSGCTQQISTVGSLPVAYSARLPRISRVRMMAPRSGGARESRSWHDLRVAHESSGQN